MKTIDIINKFAEKHKHNSEAAKVLMSFCAGECSHFAPANENICELCGIKFIKFSRLTYSDLYREIRKICPYADIQYDGTEDKQIVVYTGLRTNPDPTTLDNNFLIEI